MFANFASLRLAILSGGMDGINDCAAPSDFRLLPSQLCEKMCTIAKYVWTHVQGTISRSDRVIDGKIRPKSRVFHRNWTKWG